MEAVPITKATRVVQVVAFIDWNSQLMLAAADPYEDPERSSKEALRLTTRRIARCLSPLGEGTNFKVALRLYHGWHKGFEPSVSLRAVQIAIATADFSAMSQRDNVIFSDDVTFGCRLLSALGSRLHPKLLIHLPNTLRQRQKNKWEEKMVDTALAADVVTAAYSEPASWVLVVAEDDDAIPPVFSVEPILSTLGSRVILLRTRSSGATNNLDSVLITG